MYLRFIKQHGSDVHIPGILLERHGFGLAGLMVLKGIVFELFLLFFHQMVLRGGAIMMYRLQMSSVSSVDSAIGALDHVGSSTFQYFSHSTSCPLQGPVPCLLGKNWTCSLTLRTCRSLALGFVEVFLLFLLKFNEFLPNLANIDMF